MGFHHELYAINFLDPEFNLSFSAKGDAVGPRPLKNLKPENLRSGINGSRFGSFGIATSWNTSDL
jgi:hypothetical protein